MKPQEGLLHPPGVFNALAVWRLSRMSAARQVREAASQVHAWPRGAEDVRAVLAFDAGLVSPLAEGEQGAPLLPRRSAHARIPSTQAQVLLQLSANSRERLLWALRRAAALFAGVLVPEEEVLGGPDRLGAPSSPDDVYRAAIVPSGPLAGAAWLLYLRFQQDAPARTAQAPSPVMHDGEAEAPRLALRQGPAQAMDTRRYTARSLIRRGFSFHQGGEEGLAFVAMSADPAGFRRALDAMLGVDGAPPDALLRQASATGGGLYLAPPRDWFLDAGHRDSQEAAH